MPIRRYNFVQKEYYHLYNRGSDKRVIFKDIEDYKHFLYLFYICNTEKSILLRDLPLKFERGESIVDIGAYCLMPNHFHLITRERKEGGIQKFMQKVCTAYVMYFNKKYKRTGVLFEGRFKSKYIHNDIYFKYLYAYVHLNPLKLIEPLWKENVFKNKSKSFEYVFSYPYSSIVEYRENKFNICSPSNFPTYFKKPQDHKNEILEWITYDEN